MRLITSFWTIIAIAASLSVAMLVFAFTHFYQPVVKETGYVNALADQLQTEADKLPQAKKRKEKAIQMVNQKAAEWEDVVATKTPPTNVAAGGIDISVDPYQLQIDTIRFRDSLQRAVNAQVTKGGVKLIGTAPEVPGLTDYDNAGGVLAAFYNYQSFNFPVVILNLGTVTVQGTYEQIIANVESYKAMPHYLAVTDGLRIDGTSPYLTGTYQLSVVGFIRDPSKKIWGAPPEGAVATTTAGPGGFGGFGGLGRGGRGGPPGQTAGGGPFGPGGGPPGAGGMPPGFQPPSGFRK